MAAAEKGVLHMGTEIERKFLPKSDAWRKKKSYVHHIRQGYLARTGGNTTRVRISKIGKRNRAMLCIKGPATPQGVVPEYEYQIPVADAEELLQLCNGDIIEKKRHHIWYKGLLFEVDEFLGNLEGHIMVEVELSVVGQHISLPKWVGKEVTRDRRYANTRLSIKGWPVNTAAT